jgi:two-component sensor histidine kinase
VTSKGAAHHPKLFMLAGATENFLFYLLWSLVHAFIRSSQRAQAQERRIAAVREGLLRDENEALVYALNPELVERALMRIGKTIDQRDHAAAGAMVVAFAEQMRETLRRPRDGGGAERAESEETVVSEAVESVDLANPMNLRRWALVAWAGLLGVVFWMARSASHGAPGTFIAEYGPQPLVGALWCLLMQRHLDRRAGGPLKRLYAQAALLCFAGLAVSSTGLVLSFWAVGRLEAAYTVSTIPGLEFSYMAPAFFAWATAYFILDARRREILRLRGEAEMREAALTARNAMLRQQINPHFLFNALNALYALLLDRELERARGMVAAVRRFLDRAGDPARGDFVDLSSELATQDAYLEIERLRFGDRLQVRTSFDGEIGAAQVPHLILQPLVENAVKHGLARTSEPVLVEIRAAREGGELVLQVRDSGASEMRPRASGLGVGLGNVEARLRGVYGPAARLACERLDPRGFLAEVRLPLKHDGSGGFA